MPPAWFHGFRYLLSLSGRDGGSNFLPAAQTQGVVLKEEDGWELFYSGAFHPWEHFIPLAPGAVDLEERLEWARGNPAACQQMSKAARDVCARIANAETRRAWLRMVAEAASVQAP
nr:glycosyl transferase family 90 [Frigidibacter albus]